MSNTIVETILEFAFGPDEAPATVQERLVQRWFVHDDAFDAEIRRRFADLIDVAIAGELDSWAKSARGRLALLFILDQFPRNLYRNTPGAYAGDSAAQRLALEGIARGDDLAVAPRQRAFCYLPLEHAEDLVLQRRSVALFTALAADPLAVPRQQYETYLDYARRHMEVIQRFGRFPHRNRALGRPSNPDEQAYLSAAGGF
ncbi:MAG: DUF924 domain-containing protein [Rhodanobacteraceae bacterium]|nr:DUF924 domain-containing protein [Rhodanobacteraceae bacterium]